MFNFKWRKTLRVFINSAWERFQLDFARSDGQILLQVFKSQFVDTWDVDFDTGKSSFVLLVHFHKDKLNNESNLKRFMEMDIIRKYEEVEFEGQLIYLGRSNARSRKELSADIRETIEGVYRVDMKKIFYSLRSF